MIIYSSTLNEPKQYQIASKLIPIFPFWILNHASTKAKKLKVWYNQQQVSITIINKHYL